MTAYTHTTGNVTLWTARPERESLFLEDGVVALGGAGTGDLSALTDRAAFKARYDAAYPEAAPMERTAGASLLYRLVREMRTGDCVVFTAGNQARLGVVTGEYFYEAGSEFPHRRPVDWRTAVPLAGISRNALREISCSPMALFAVKRFPGEFFNALGVPYLEPERPALRTAPPKKAVAEPSDPERQAVRKPAGHPVRTAARPCPAESAPAFLAGQEGAEAASRAESFVLAELNRHPAHREFQEFMAGVLQAMGYRVTAFSLQDGGRFDLAVCRDELSPRTLVRLQTGGADAEDAARFARTVGEDEFGLYLSLSDFSPEVRRILDAAPRVRGVDGAGVAGLVLKYYARLDERRRAVVPLRLAYVPVA